MRIADASQSRAPTGRLSIIYPRLNKPFLQANGLYELETVILSSCDSLQLSRFVPEAIVGRETFKGTTLLARWKRAKKRVFQGTEVAWAKGWRVYWMSMGLIKVNTDCARAELCIRSVDATRTCSTQKERMDQLCGCTLAECTGARARVYICAIQSGNSFRVKPRYHTDSAR